MKYKTRNREILLSFLGGQEDRHWTLAELKQGLSDAGKSIPQASLYRLLDELTEEGVVRRCASGVGPVCFQYCKEAEEHLDFHLVCSKCGKLMHLECKEVKHLIEHIEEEHGFAVDISKVNLYGLCKECRENKQ